MKTLIRIHTRLLHKLALVGVIGASLTSAGPGADLALVDTNFHVGTGVWGSYVHTIATRADGAILIGGNFTRVQGLPRNHFAQLSRDGTLDTNFVPSSGASGEVLAALYQSDGKAVIAGVFMRVNGTNRNRIARLQPTGSTDLSFDPGVGPDSEVRSLGLQKDGKIMIGGTFSKCGGVSRAGVARLNPDGSLDPSFNPGTGVGGERFVDELVVLDNGKIILAGDFASYNGVQCGSIVRLHADGTLDTTFNAGAGAKPGDPILGTAIQPDGKLLVVGSFTGFNSRTLRNVARLNEDGSLDTTFNPGAGTGGGPINGLLHSVAVEPDGKILLGGWFDRLDNQPRGNLARLLPWGRPDTNWCPRADAQVRAIKLDADHNSLLAGDFTRINETTQPKMSRLGASGPIPATLKKCSCNTEPGPHFNLFGDPVRNYRLQVSSDLHVWEPWMDASCSNGWAHVVDPEVAVHARRFYRAVLVDTRPTTASELGDPAGLGLRR